MNRNSSTRKSSPEFEEELSSEENVPPYEVDQEDIDEAVKILSGGGVILYPTDTIWGLGCDATDEKAVERIYAIKHRPDAKSLVTLAADMNMVAEYIREVPSIASMLDEVSDTPLTIIYPGAEGLAPNVVAEDGSVGIRIPRHEFCRRLLRRFRKPIVSTSANISGEPSPVSYEDIPGSILAEADWCADPIYEAGATGRASSIIKLGVSNEVTVIRK